MLQVYNSLTRQKERFVPMIPGQIGMYACGNTVYDHCHLGHARSMVCFDVMRRHLMASGFKVKFVRNITDIDDKIINRAQERAISIEELTETYIKAMHDDTHALGIIPPDFEPRATDHIAGIIRLIERLMSLGYAYLSDSGDVCYEVKRFAEYGKLSNKDLDSLISGVRVDIDRDKKSPLDFVLWKKAKPSEPSWPSPWGEGRPGWHIECSEMAMHTLGEQFDIHGGGVDLKFPHHENEVAQSEAATGKPFANYWLHVGMLQVNNEKMAKSLGNFFTIQDVLKKYHAEVIRYFLISAHYRSPLNYTEENLQLAQKGLQRLYQAIKECAPSADTALDERWIKRFNEAMDDDFNTPLALSVLFDLSHELNKTKSAVLAASLIHLANRLGILNEDSQAFLQLGFEDELRLEIEALIAARSKARLDKNWAKSDEIRNTLSQRGIELEDGPSGTSWRRILD